MNAYEKLGVFYLGKAFDMNSGTLREEPVLYDSKDLTTHAVIIGMTGSGKTGLGIGLLEEALIDNIPVIAIDPKGDLSNLMLTFPDLSADEFSPWVDEREALSAGLSRRQFAEKQADLWRKGLTEWGQGAERIARLRAAAEFAVYTPGSQAGIPVNALGSFAPPPPALQEDRDLMRERIQSTATALLALAGIDADPITSREHILIANLFSTVWSDNKGLDLPGLVRAVQDPPFDRVGVMDLDSFYPAKDRFQLAMRFNNLLAAPGFEAWLEGAPLDIGRLLHTPEGRPRAAIFSISHLAESERMFFVSKLLNEILAWVRTQPGTSSLRAVLYMDEIFGFFPPVANPPSKQPLLTLLKQARAYGLGVVLATQNPVDLDYKGLANTGSWFIGRLQTEGDKQRVMAGLEGAAGGKNFDRGRMERHLAGLGKRVFLLNNVHENEPVTFQTRWTLSYLRGPLTRDQIKALTAAAGAAGRTDAPGAAAAPAPAPGPSRGLAPQPPLLPPGMNAFHLPVADPAPGIEYFPAVLACLEVHYTQTRLQVDTSRKMAFAAPVSEGPVDLDWDQAMELALDPSRLEPEPVPGASFADLPSPARDPKAYDAWSRDLGRWVRRTGASAAVAVQALRPHFTAGGVQGRVPGPARADLAGAARPGGGEAASPLRRQVHHAERPPDARRAGRVPRAGAAFVQEDRNRHLLRDRHPRGLPGPQGGQRDLGRAAGDGGEIRRASAQGEHGRRAGPGDRRGRQGADHRTRPAVAGGHRGARGRLRPDRRGPQGGPHHPDRRRHRPGVLRPGLAAVPARSRKAGGRRQGLPGSAGRHRPRRSNPGGLGGRNAAWGSTG